MIKLQNESLTLLVAEKGAELQSIKDAQGKEYLWQADPKYWPRHSPILFPLVCSVNNDTYRVDGKEYHLPRHGFARDAQFRLIATSTSGDSQQADKVTLALESSEETRKVYPFDFVLSVSYRLEANRISVIWHVLNTDSREIHFQIGGHPAFNIPGHQEGKPQSGRIRLDNSQPLDALRSYLDGSHEMTEIPCTEVEDGLMEFSNNTWRNDSIKIHKSQVHRAELLRPDGQPEVTLSFRTPVIAFWSPYDKEAPFVCIEPWYGIGDPRGFNGEFKDKPYMNHLLPGASFMSKYEIQIG
ncbi:MAG: aldose 1-epimerase family protein [Prevotella sp.]|nr:aldose 1-epimerase family protein [Prevotella sp.]